MSRTISSSMTVIYKFVFPTVWIGGFVAGTVAMFIADMPQKWHFLGALILGGSIIGWLCVPLKRVEIDGAELVVSNFFRTIRVPLLDISRVTENVLINIHPVWIYFSSPTEFGTKILFMPTSRWFAFFSSHPIVGELRSLAAGGYRKHSPPPLPRFDGEQGPPPLPRFGGEE